MTIHTDSTSRCIEITWTRRQTWFLTAPCGWHAELPGECSGIDVKTMANRHRINCCRGARVSVETVTGYRETKGAKVAS